jgi:hypothetical protein
MEGSCEYIDKQSLTANKGKSTSLELGREDKNYAPQDVKMLQTLIEVLGL